MYVIYKARSSASNKSYIGKDRYWPKRKREHHKAAKDGSQLAFHRAIRKYGANTFDWEILASCNTKEEASTMEVLLIEQHCTFSNGYNMTPGGEGGATRTGQLTTEETKQKIAASKRGIDVLTPEKRKELGLKLRGRKQSPEQVAKRVASRAQTMSSRS